MSDLTADQITTIRNRPYLGDKRGESPSFAPISQFNRATGNNFFTDDQIKTLDDTVSRRFATDLDQLEADFKNERIVQGDSDADATTKAAAERLEARYHLIAALGCQQMADDPGYIATQAVKGASIDENRRALYRQAMAHFAFADIQIELIR